MSTRIMMAIAATMSLSLFADVSVEDIKCTQRYPWNGLVDIEYTIACDDPEAEIYVNPVGFNGDTGLTVFPTHFTGDGATNTVKAGRHTMVWDAKADLGNLFATKNFQIKMYAGKKLSRYIVIDISGGTEAENYPIRHSIEGPNLADDTCRTTEIWMRLIPPSSFMMGSPESELGHQNNENRHMVTLTRPYYIGVFEVTQRQWELVKGDRPSAFNSADEYATHPVENMTYADIKYSFSKKTSQTPDTASSGSFMHLIRSKSQCVGFDLPTEAQWENACRCGVISALYDGSELMGTEGCDNLNLLARYAANGTTTAIVGSYKPNKYGLYDMSGNVMEWCRDGWIDSACENIDPLQECSTVSGEYGSSYHYYYWYFVAKGGAYSSSAYACRNAYRYKYCAARYYDAWTSTSGPSSLAHYNSKMVGFRLCCTGNLQN